MSQALRNEDVTIFGDGSQTRSFCYVSDLVEGIIRLMHSNTNDPVNIGNPHEMTIEEIAETIVAHDRFYREAGRTGRCRPTTRRCVKPDITRARTLLGWEPKVTLEQGLTSTIAYFRQKLGVTNSRRTGAPPARRATASARQYDPSPPEVPPPFRFRTICHRFRPRDHVCGEAGASAGKVSAHAQTRTHPHSCSSSHSSSFFFRRSRSSTSRRNVS